MKHLLFVLIPLAVIGAVVVVLFIQPNPQELCFRSNNPGELTIGATTVVLSDEITRITLDTGSHTYQYNRARFGSIVVFDAHSPEIKPEYGEQAPFEVNFCSMM